MTYEEKIYQFLLQAKAEMQEVFIRENKLKRKQEIYDEYKDNLNLISYGTRITVSAVILVGAFLIPQIRGDLFVFCLGLGGMIWFPTASIIRCILHRKYIKDVLSCREAYYDKNWPRMLRKLISQNYDLETYEDSQLLNEIYEINKQQDWSKRNYNEWQKYFNNKYPNISTYGKILMMLNVNTYGRIFMSDNNVIEYIDKELKNYENQHQVTEMIQQSNDQLFIFNRYIEELQNKKAVLQNMTENQALIHNLSNIININLDKLRKIQTNATLTHNLTDNLNEESKKQTMQQIQESNDEAKQVYQEAMNLIHETISVINDQQSDNELNINESFQAVLKSYKNRM